MQPLITDVDTTSIASNTRQWYNLGGALLLNILFFDFIFIQVDELTVPSPSPSPQPEP